MHQKKVGREKFEEKVLYCPPLVEFWRLESWNGLEVGSRGLFFSAYLFLVHFGVSQEDPEKEIENFNFWAAASRKTEISRFYPKIWLRTTFSYENIDYLMSAVARNKSESILER